MTSSPWGGHSSITYYLMGYCGFVDSPCEGTNNMEWRGPFDKFGTSLLLIYDDLEVWGDTCDYKASVGSYSGVGKGTRVGQLTCTKWRPATCYCGDYKNVQVYDCLSDVIGQPTGLGSSVAEEIVCRWE